MDMEELKVCILMLYPAIHSGPRSDFHCPERQEITGQLPRGSYCKEIGKIRNMPSKVVHIQAGGTICVQILGTLLQLGMCSLQHQKVHFPFLHFSTLYVHTFM